jgi:CRP-like cAMP-binding protein
MCEGDEGEEMYFINRGTVEVYSTAKQRVYRTMSDGEFFGERALVRREKR